VLPGISTEQLRSRLNRMVADGLLTRRRYREVPPRVDYELTERARDLLPVIGALARWGARWAWSEPRADEHVDIGAILRTLPGLALPEEVSGEVEIVVALPDGAQPKHYLLTASDGRIALSEGPSEHADARITGSLRAWIDAFGPDAETGGLELSGDTDLAAALLDALALPGVREAPVA
jgi:hypothetical protein